MTDGFPQAFDTMTNNIFDIMTINIYVILIPLFSPLPLLIPVSPLSASAMLVIPSSFEVYLPCEYD